MLYSKSVKLSVLCSVFLLIPCFCLAEISFPDFPMAFWGNATLNGDSLSSGTTIKAYCDNNLVGEIVLVEDGIYGYNLATKNKLLILSCDTKIVFKYLLAGESNVLMGITEVNYIDGFESGKVVEKDLNFTTSVVIDNNMPANYSITVPSYITDAQLDVSALLSGTDIKTVTLPGSINIDTTTSIGDVNIQIPSGINISAGSSWTGEINVPQVKENSSVTATPDSGNTASISSVIEMGFDDVKLTFDKAVRILLTGQAGRYIGYSRSGVFTQITTVCTADNQASVDAQLIGSIEDCKIDVGSDLVVWTKHFTKFATYTQTVIPSTSVPNTGGGGGGGGGVTTPPPVSIKGDINNDSKVNKYDFALIMANWGKTGSNNSDLNSDNKVDKYDFSLLMLNWS